ncbi:hypothetical protein SEUCBS140593_003108 [Sporothrix eucalyptigena]|uniref:Uncharacterized protein n=1 Tax=Sporothrix eucalyptigena TaxID=1812306 RepID=A0ABP0BC46_9PEZI
MVIKNSVGLSTAPLNKTGQQGGRTASATWAQVAARPKGGLAAPPPALLKTNNSADQPTVTAYKERAVTVKLRDHGLV